MIDCKESGCLWHGEDEAELEDHMRKMAKYNLHESQISGNPRPFCIGCYRVPAEILEYQHLAESRKTSPDRVVQAEEGTYNAENGHFLCSVCYINVGMPSSPEGWKAP